MPRSWRAGGYRPVRSHGRRPRTPDSGACHVARVADTRHRRCGMPEHRPGVRRESRPAPTPSGGRGSAPWPHRYRHSRGPAGYSARAIAPLDPRGRRPHRRYRLGRSRNMSRCTGPGRRSRWLGLPGSVPSPRHGSCRLSFRIHQERQSIDRHGARSVPNASGSGHGSSWREQPHRSVAGSRPCDTASPSTTTIAPMGSYHASGSPRNNLPSRVENRGTMYQQPPGVGESEAVAQRRSKAQQVAGNLPAPGHMPVTQDDQDSQPLARAPVRP